MVQRSSLHHPLSAPNRLIRKPYVILGHARGRGTFFLMQLCLKSHHDNVMLPLPSDNSARIYRISYSQNRLSHKVRYQLQVSKQIFFLLT